MNHALIRRAARSISQPCRHRPPRPIPAVVRHNHTLSALGYPVEDGLPGFLSKEALQLVAVDYQKGLLDRLNDEIKGTEYESKSLVQTVIESAPKREHSQIFNYASQAMSNGFFLDNLSPKPRSNRPDALANFSTQLTAQFGSQTVFKSAMSAAAMGMVGSGWVWLVMDRQSRLAPVATYGAGTMLVRSRRQANPVGQVASQPSNSSSRAPSTHFDPYSSSSQLRSNEQTFRWFAHELNPIFCISVHEHAWMSDYGIWGKEEYLENFWKVLDWEKVTKHFDLWFALNQNNPLP